MEYIAAIITVITGAIAIIEGFSKKILNKNKQKKELQYADLSKKMLSDTNDNANDKMIDLSATIISSENDIQKCINTDINDWYLDMRRKLICPFWATNMANGTLGYVKRVMPICESNEDIIFQVTLENGDSNVFWLAQDIYPIDRLSYNFKLLQNFREFNS